MVLKSYLTGRFKIGVQHENEYSELKNVSTEVRQRSSCDSWYSIYCIPGIFHKTMKQSWPPIFADDATNMETGDTIEEGTNKF